MTKTANQKINQPQETTTPTETPTEKPKNPGGDSSKPEEQIETVSLETENVMADIEPIDMKMSRTATQPEEPKPSTPKEEKKTDQVKEKKKEALTPEFKAKRDGCLKDVLDQSLIFIVNQSYLQDHPNQISIQEFSDTGFSANVVKSINHYFPDWNFDHPLFLLGLSSVSVMMLINSKKPMVGGKKENGKSTTKTTTTNAESSVGENKDNNSERGLPEGNSGNGSTNANGNYLKS